ncbi:MAG: hypothetical protein KGM46_07325 [Pseudomonadota bacterium]|nr:hypothetical protein [Pseudomonadota bacterium]
MTSAPAIGFEYRPSRLPGRALIVMCCLALLAVACCGLAPWQQALLALALVANASRVARKLAATPVIAAGWSADAGWTVHLSGQRDVAVVLASFRVLGPYVLLRLKAPARTVHVLFLAPDNSDADIRRRLRMRLATMASGEALPRW